MKCEWVKENVLLYVYNELADDARYELEQHLARCADCTAELKTTRKFHAMLSELPVEEPSPNLVAASRMRLQEGLETAEQGKFWHRLIFDPAAWLRQIRFAPALAAAIFIVGFAGGIGTTYKVVNGNGASIASGRQSLRSNLPSPAFSPSLRIPDRITSALSTTRFPRRKRKARSTISASSNCCSLRRATTTTRVCGWIPSIC